MQTKEDLSHKERTSKQETNIKPHATIKAARPSQTKVSISLPQLWHSRVAKVL